MSAQRVWRLRFQCPAVDSGDNETGYPGGDPVEDLDGSLEWNAPVTRYYFRKDSLEKKLERLANWSNEYDLKWEPPVAARVLSIEEGTITWTPGGTYPNIPVAEFDSVDVPA